MSACHRTSDRQEYKNIWRAGPERDMIFHLRVLTCHHEQVEKTLQMIINGSIIVNKTE